MTEQLELRLPCPACGSVLHDGCGYDPEEVKPVMTIIEALGLLRDRQRHEPRDQGRGDQD